MDDVDENVDNDEDGAKRKSKSGVWAHFTNIELDEKGQMVKKEQCIHCKKTYKSQKSGTTSHLLWNSTHRMLESAMHYKLAFQGYALRDSNFEWFLTDEEWDRAEKVCKLLEVFLDATNLFSGTSYPTSNLFLVEIFKVKKEIVNAFISNDDFLKNMSVPMYEKFEKYWGEIGVLMSIASILDPRFKKESVSWTFERLYPLNEVDSRVEDVINKLRSLYEKYFNAYVLARAAKSSSTSTCTPSGVQNIRAREEDDFYAYLKSRPVESTEKSELDVYLEEPKYLSAKEEEDLEIKVLTSDKAFS
ncbi:hypothetical protein E3N88_15518 [Mikania micrantha]|uniref:BED-type domain-containing protein n=1 Tax=Mikania micrantha TaxID=192012 RepID=A0A5N6NX27_9ASTR|nr:hypothetical protein E3N88_15518 [Mikania micrantha]